MTAETLVLETVVAEAQATLERLEWSAALRELHRIAREAEAKRAAEFRYREMPASSLPAAWVGLVHRSAERFSAELGIDCPPVRFFTKAYGADPVVWVDERDMGGWTARNDPAIWVRATQPLKAVVRTVAHECRHRWQYEVGMPDVDMEPDAEAWAAQMVPAMPGRRGA